jgi:hypothetical protein
MRQYFIYYRRGGPDRKWGKLTPNVHQGLYQREPVEKAIAFIRDNPAVEGVALRIDDEQFNIIAFAQGAEAPQAFKFEGAA